MKTALFADVHSNLEALQACLAHAERSGAEEFVFLGDLVGYGADPDACIERIAELVRRGAAVAVLGNHDAAVVSGWCGDMNIRAREAVYWTRERLSPGRAGFLESLPLSVRAGERMYVHASPHAPRSWNYVTGSDAAAEGFAASDARLIFVGHVHHQVLYHSVSHGASRPFVPLPGVPIELAAPRRWLAIAGSVGQQRDGTTAAAYALLDGANTSLTFQRVPYDHAAAGAKRSAAGFDMRWDLLAGIGT
ncbi:MAG: metallophosphoesterase [Betaproteobacteria bacterium]|nr:metallophosphoesterase [Betaproteobacteria bacterium]